MIRSLCAVAALATLTLSSLPAAAAPGAGDKKVVAVPWSLGSPNDHDLGMMGHNAQPTFITELVKSKQVRVVDEKRADDAIKHFEKGMAGPLRPSQSSRSASS